ncbi:MAG: GNAT family N-acetyltransferase [Candidatus Hodarchaeota archaeon]
MDEQEYKIINVNETNIDEYDLFCHKSKKKKDGYRNKVRWIKDRFNEGLRLKLLLINEGKKRGFKSRGFIEYIPGEYNWRGISADNYMIIHCLWVVGRNKKKGYGSMLIDQCVAEAKGMYGVAVLTSERTWLPGRRIFVKNGFKKVDTVSSNFELYVKRFSENSPLPSFNKSFQKRRRRFESGLTVFHSDQCPYLCNMTGSLRDIAETLNIPFKVEYILNCKDAQNGVHPYGTFCVLYNGEVLTYHSDSRKNLLNLLVRKGVELF